MEQPETPTAHQVGTAETDETGFSGFVAMTASGTI